MDKDIQNESQAETSEIEVTQEDLAKLFNYPSIGELFSETDTQRLDEFCARLKQTSENLERIVRYGSRDEAERAQRATRAVQVTLEFLENLQKMRLEQQK